ncbi:unnamed protein product, partial [Phaeothamnion confervicola]
VAVGFFVHSLFIRSLCLFWSSRGNGDRPATLLRLVAVLPLHCITLQLVSASRFPPSLKDSCTAAAGQVTVHRGNALYRMLLPWLRLAFHSIFSSRNSCRRYLFPLRLLPAD